jgi:hypothetical protein
MLTDFLVAGKNLRKKTLAMTSQRMHNALVDQRTVGKLSVTPFDSVMRSRAAFDAGQNQSDVVAGLSQACFETYGKKSFVNGGQPPLSQGSEQILALKVNAPPLTLDFSANPTDSVMNAAGILKMRQQDGGAVALKERETSTISFANPETKAYSALETRATATALKPESLALKPAEKKAGTVADNATIADNTLPRRTPALNFAEFSSLDGDAAKFQQATYDLSIKPTSDGSSQIQHKYTAADFSTCTLSSRNGTISAVVADKYARKTLQEDIGPDGKSTVSRFSYDDAAGGGKKAMFASRKDVTGPDGTTQAFNYNRYGQVVQA